MACLRSVGSCVTMIVCLDGLKFTLGLTGMLVDADKEEEEEEGEEDDEAEEDDEVRRVEGLEGPGRTGGEANIV